MTNDSTSFNVADRMVTVICLEQRRTGVMERQSPQKTRSRWMDWSKKHWTSKLAFKVVIWWEIHYCWGTVEAGAFFFWGSYTRAAHFITIWPSAVSTKCKSQNQDQITIFWKRKNVWENMSHCSAAHDLKESIFVSVFMNMKCSCNVSDIELHSFFFFTKSCSPRLYHKRNVSHQTI